MQLFHHSLIVFIIISLRISLSMVAQQAAPVCPQYDFTNPVQGYISLSSDFGEIRSNHFHMGADIRLKTGEPIYAVADGYISRFKTEPGGYGRALYIDHPEGLRSVYCHLHDFTPEIKAYIRQEQLAAGTFKVTGYLPPDRFPVKKGQLIAYGGNSGYSFGAHLHFEMRHSENDVTINPYHFFNFGKDNRALEIFGIQISPADGKSSAEGQNKALRYTLSSKGNTYYPRENITASGRIGISYRAVDRKPNQRSKFGIYKAELFADDSLIFAFQKDEISYYETRYLNSFSDYELYRRKRLKYTDLFREKGNHLSLYTHLKNDGYIDVKKSEKKHIKIKLYDFWGNRSIIKFTITGEAYQPEEAKKCEHYMTAGETNYFFRDDFRMMADEKAFYQDFCLHYGSYSSDGAMYSDWHSFYGYYTPIHAGVSISIRTDSLPPELIPKLCLVRKGSKGQLIDAGGSYLNGFMTGNIRYFGQYAVAADTIPPELTPLNFRAGTSIKDLKTIQFETTDNLSGLYRYQAVLNNIPTVAEYDLKNDLLEIYIPEEIYSHDQVYLTLKLYDRKDNETGFQFKFAH